MVCVAEYSFASRSGTDSTIRAAHTIAPRSPCRNWLNCQDAQLRLVLAGRLRPVAGAVQGQGLVGAPSGSYGSASRSQSTRFELSQGEEAFAAVVVVPLEAGGAGGGDGPDGPVGGVDVGITARHCRLFRLNPVRSRGLWQVHTLLDVESTSGVEGIDGSC
ncbi:hypothetical protein M877_12060 [Streptomyces niveus NCIMB 11891]|nr:hypothetical protein M877_12060 [Streptomyces niveus NCIMB 11891]